jgi:hypothetical protein
MIPESKCAFLDIFADPPVDHGVHPMVKSELNNNGRHSSPAGLRLTLGTRIFSDFLFCHTRNENFI